MSDPFLDWIEAELREDLAMYDVEWACPDCGRRDVWTSALWDEPPSCCGWSMIDLPGTLKRGSEPRPALTG